MNFEMSETSQTSARNKNLAGAKVEDIIEQFSQDLIKLCSDKIHTLLGYVDTSLHYSVELDLQLYAETNIWLCERLVDRPMDFLPLLDEGLSKAQRRILLHSDITIHLYYKKYAHVRFVKMPPFPDFFRTRIPRSEDVGRLISLKGTVIRSGMIKMLEFQRRFECTKCKHRFVVQCDREQNNIIPKPTHCEGVTPTKESCDSNKFKEIVAESGEMPATCKDYQEIKVQEQISKLAVGTIPRSIAVILEDDLVDQAKAGDEVTVLGAVIRRWKTLNVGSRCDIEVVIFANSVRIHNEQRSNVLVTDEMRAEFKEHWEKYKDTPMEGRNIILKSVCPKVYGMFTVKLAVMLVLIGGIAKYDSSGMKVRGDAHMLLVGDPGTGKSQFLRYAAKLSPRTVLTTGIGSTNAGLTVTAVRDSGEWQLEAGALVLADRGLCCIDEFGSIREHDKTAIHEAMEQQTISVAKAGLVCKLNSRCAILAATNPKGKYDPNQNVSVNIALASPLLSRFDLIIVLVDGQNQDWDGIVSSFILGTESNEHALSEITEGLWNIEKLQTYIQHVKSSCFPRLTDDSNAVLKRYYQAQRGADIRNAARTTIRLLESLIRLAQAHARLMSQDEVTVRDAVVAVMLMEASMQSSALAGVSSTLHVPFPDDPDSDYQVAEAKILHKLGLVDLIGVMYRENKLTPSPETPSTKTPEKRKADDVADDAYAADDQNFENYEYEEEIFCSWEASQQSLQQDNIDLRNDKGKAPELVKSKSALGYMLPHVPQIQIVAPSTRYSPTRNQQDESTVNASHMKKPMEHNSNVVGMQNEVSLSATRSPENTIQGKADERKSTKTKLNLTKPAQKPIDLSNFKYQKEKSDIRTGGTKISQYVALQNSPAQSEQANETNALASPFNTSPDLSRGVGSLPVGSLGGVLQSGNTVHSVASGLGDDEFGYLGESPVPAQSSNNPPSDLPKNIDSNSSVGGSNPQHRKKFKFRM